MQRPVWPVWGAWTLLWSVLMGEEDSALGELLPGSRGNVEEEVAEALDGEQLRAVLWEMVDDLEGQQPEVIRRRYQDGNTLAEIGVSTGIPRKLCGRFTRRLSAVSGIPNTAGGCGHSFRKLIGSTSLCVGMACKFNRTWTSSTEREALNLVGGHRDPGVE